MSNTARDCGQSKDSQPDYLTYPRINEGSGSNWVHPSVAVIETDACGRGIIATEHIQKGALIIVYGGKVITTEQFEDLSEHMQHYPYQIADDLFIGPQDENDIGAGERINHSCNPNVGFKGEIKLIAIRDIEPGEQLTMDYGTCVSADDDAFLMECCCGAPGCRQTITGQDWRLPELQGRLLNYFQPYLQDKILREPANNIDLNCSFPIGVRSIVESD